MKSSRRSFLSALLGLPIVGKVLLSRPAEAKVAAGVPLKDLMPQPGPPYLGLFDENEREVSGNGYARVRGGRSGDWTTVTFPEATGAWGRVTHLGICEGPDGPPLWFIPFDCYGDVRSGDTVRAKVHPSC